MAHCVPSRVGYVHRELCHGDFPLQAGPQLRGHVPPSSVNSLFSLVYWRVRFYCPIRPRLASSLVLLYLCWPPPRCPGWSGVGCSHLQAVREGSNLERERGFLCILAGAQAMCPKPASPGLSSPGHHTEIPTPLIHTHTSPRAAPLQLEH